MFKIVVMKNIYFYLPNVNIYKVVITLQDITFVLLSIHLFWSYHIFHKIKLEMII